MSNTSFICHICGNTKYLPFNHNLPGISARSKVPKLHVFENAICTQCCVVSTYPQIEEDSLVEYYNGEYRKSEYSITTASGTIEPPLQIPWSGVSFQRAQTFYNCWTRNLDGATHNVMGSDTEVIDLGGYQGMFLYALQRIYGVKCSLYDYSKAGIEFASKAFGFDTFLANNIETDRFPHKYDVVTMIHSFEHIRHPIAFLNNLKDNILKESGFFYIEVPNAFAHPLDDPTHFHMYSVDTLCNLMISNGFEIIEIGTTGFGCKHSIFNTDQQNIYCLCRFPKSTSTPDITFPDSDKFKQAIWKQHIKVSAISIVNGIKEFLSPISRAWRTLKRITS